MFGGFGAGLALTLCVSRLETVLA
jgi:hypothetical protein